MSNFVKIKHFCQQHKMYFFSPEFSSMDKFNVWDFLFLVT